MAQQLEWYYLDARGQEFGPFPGSTMRQWADSGQFEAAGDQLLVRLPQWKDHERLTLIYGGDKQAYFIEWPPLQPHGGSSPSRSRSPRDRPARRRHENGDPDSGRGPPPQPQGPWQLAVPATNGHAYAPPAARDRGPPPPPGHPGGHWPPPHNGYAPPPASGYGAPPPGYGPPPHGGYAPPPSGYCHPAYGYRQFDPHIYGEYRPPAPGGYPLPPVNGYGPPPGAPPHPGYGAPPPPPLGYSPYSLPPEYGSHPPPDERDRSGKGRGSRNSGAKHENLELNRRLIKTSDAVTKGTRNFGEFLAEIDSNIDRMNEVNLSTAFHRVAKICKADAKEQTLKDPRFRRLQDRVGSALWRNLPLLGTSDGRQVPMSAACVCWAHATLRLTDAELFTEVARRCSPHMRNFKNLEVANLLWAFAKLGENGGYCIDLFNAAAHDVMARPHDFSVVNLSTLAWAFATARAKNPSFFKTVAQRIEQNSSKAESQEIANTLWAFATAGAYDKRMFAALGKQASHKLSTFKPQEAANVAWAFGRAGIVHLDFFDGLERHLQHCRTIMALNDFLPQHLAMIIGACAQLHPSEDAEDDDVHDEKMAGYNNDEADEPSEDRPLTVIATAGPDGHGSQGHAVAWNIAAMVLPECGRKTREFKVEEAAKVYGACKRLGLRRPESGNLLEAQQQAIQAASEFIRIVSEQLPAALTLSLKPKR